MYSRTALIKCYHFQPHNFSKWGTGGGHFFKDECALTFLATTGAVYLRWALLRVCVLVSLIKIILPYFLVYLSRPFKTKFVA